MPTVVYSDNNAAISIATNDRTEERSKHIDVKFHYTRELVRANQIKVEHCGTDNMLADYLTKFVTKKKFLWCRDQVGLRLFPASVWGGCCAQSDSVPCSRRLDQFSVPSNKILVLIIVVWTHQLLQTMAVTRCSPQEDDVAYNATQIRMVPVIDRSGCQS